MPLRHDFGVDIEILWVTATEDIPAIKPRVQKMLKDLEKNQHVVEFYE